MSVLTPQRDTDDSSRASGRDYWNEQGRRFPRSFFGAPTTRFYLHEEQRLFRTYFGDLRGKRLLKLDLWNEAQNTEILFWAASQGAECFGSDIAETTVEKAKARSRERGQPIRIAVADALMLPYADASFDCLYTMGTLEHLPDPDRAFAELRRVLKPGGVAIVGVPNRHDPFMFCATSKLLQACNAYPYGYEHWYTNGELQRRLEAEGLEFIARDAILFLPWPIRFLDMFLWLHARPACALTWLLLQPFRALARFPRLTRRLGYLTACVVQK
jgi:SAM-dependent methyltransferase